MVYYSVHVLCGWDEPTNRMCIRYSLRTLYLQDLAVVESAGPSLQCRHNRTAAQASRGTLVIPSLSNNYMAMHPSASLVVTGSRSHRPQLDAKFINVHIIHIIHHNPSYLKHKVTTLESS